MSIYIILQKNVKLPRLEFGFSKTWPFQNLADEIMIFDFLRSAVKMSWSYVVVWKINCLNWDQNAVASRLIYENYILSSSSRFFLSVICRMNIRENTQEVPHLWKEREKSSNTSWNTSKLLKCITTSGFQALWFDSFETSKTSKFPKSEFWRRH